MSYDTNITVAGHVGSEPRFFPADGDTPAFVTFRLASTRSYFNKAKGTWVESETTWFTVKAWRILATNLADSVRKGDAVLVHGALDTQRWQKNDGTQRETLVIEAHSAGHNLTRGTANFRTNKTAAGQGAEQDRAKAPQANTAWETAPTTESSVPPEEDPFDPENAVAHLTEIGDGEYAELNDESLTNVEVDEPKLAMSA